MSPRLHGYRERLYGNFYDALSVLKMDDEDNRLFTNRNIGVSYLTNMHVAGQLNGDQTLVLANVYVRTNLGRTRPALGEEQRKEVRDLFVDDNNGDAIGTLMRACQWERTPLVKALEEWAHASIVEVVIGSRVMFMMNVADLMDGPALGPGPSEQRIVEGERLPWRKQIDPVIVVPARMNIDVRLRSAASASHALKRFALEACVQPEPLVWVHLEGLATRDVQ